MITSGDPNSPQGALFTHEYLLAGSPVCLSANPVNRTLSGGQDPIPVMQTVAEIMRNDPINSCYEPVDDRSIDAVSGM